MSSSRSSRVEPAKPDDEPSEANPIVQFLETMKPIEAAIVDRMAELDRLHGDKPTPRE